MIKNFLILFLTLILFSTSTVAENIRVFEFTDEEFKNLQVKKVKGETKWTLGSNENGAYIKAEAEGVGSGLGKEIEIDLNNLPNKIELYRSVQSFISNYLEKKISA